MGPWTSPPWAGAASPTPRRPPRTCPRSRTRARCSRPATCVWASIVEVPEAYFQGPGKDGDTLPPLSLALERQPRRGRGPGVHGAGHGRGGGPGGRLQLHQEPVQPRHPGPAPARLGLQAHRLFHGHGQRLHPGLHRPRRAHRLPGLRQRQALEARELRGRVLRAHAAAHGFGQIAQPGHHPGGHAPGHRQDHPARQGHGPTERVPRGPVREPGLLARDAHQYDPGPIRPSRAWAPRSNPGSSSA